MSDMAGEIGTHGRLGPAGPVTILLLASPSSFAAESRAALLESGFAVAQARGGAEALRRARRGDVPAAVLSLMLPGEDAFGVLGALLDAAPGTRVVAAAAAGAVNRAAAALEAGAFDYLVQPTPGARVVATVRNALAAGPRPPAEPDAPPPGLIGASPAMRAFFARLRRLAPTLAPVLIFGERGAGRRRAAEALHAASARARGPYLVLDAAELGDDRLEAALFGAQDSPPGEGGALAAARGGSLLIDGLSSVGPALQGRLLRLLQGAGRPSVDEPRLIFATSEDLGLRVREARFRDELHHRLSVATLDLPPLRDRGADVGLIADAALAAASARAGRRFASFHPEVLRAFAAHPWPGNVRQLLDAVRAAVDGHDAEMLTPAMLPAELFAAARASGASARRRTGADAAPGAGVALADPAAPLAVRVAPLVGARLADVEAALIEATMARCGGSAQEAAKVLGVAPSTLYRRMGRTDSGGEGDG